MGVKIRIIFPMIIILVKTLIQFKKIFSFFIFLDPIGRKNIKIFIITLEKINITF